jgi:hypothetical protein
VAKLCFELFEIVDFVQGEIIFSAGDLPHSQISLRRAEDIRQERKKKLENSLKFEKPSIKGFYIILEGRADLQTYQGLMEFTLNVGDYLGENLLFKSDSIALYGRVRAGSSKTRCLFLPKQ